MLKDPPGTLYLDINQSINHYMRLITDYVPTGFFFRRVQIYYLGRDKISNQRKCQNKKNTANVHLSDVNTIIVVLHNRGQCYSTIIITIIML